MSRSQLVSRTRPQVGAMLMASIMHLGHDFFVCPDVIIEEIKSLKSFLDRTIPIGARLIKVRLIKISYAKLENCEVRSGYH